MISCFISYKGGVGKTTSCINIAGFLKTFKKSVLVVDCDAQANATSALGIAKESIENSIYDVLTGNTKMRNIILENREEIHVAPANMELAKCNISDKRELKSALEEVEDLYDFILIDTPPSASVLMLNGVYASDLSFPCFDGGVLALESYSVLDSILRGEEIEAKMDCALVCKYGKNLRERIFGKEKEIIADISKLFDEIFVVPYDYHTGLSQIEGKSLASLHPNSGAGKAYREIAEWLLRR